MKTIKIIIEKNADGFWAFAENVKGITGGGDTVKECKQGVLDCIDTLREIGQFPYEEGSYELAYKFDTQSLLDYYKGIFTLSALHRITGINERQLQHYSTGLRKPRPEQREKIEKALHNLGEELLSVEL